MKSWLFVGAKVVCVDATRTNNLGLPELVEGKIYTLRRIDASFDRDPDVWLEGRHRYVSPFTDGNTFPFRASRFRPVSTIDATREVEALRKLAREASQTGKVSA